MEVQYDETEYSMYENDENVGFCYETNNVDIQNALNMSDQDFELLLEQESKKFEEILLQHEKEPLKRALERKEFYSKQNELRVERERTAGMIERKKIESGVRVTRDIEDRVFEIGYGSKTYHGPYIGDKVKKYKKDMVHKYYNEEQRRRPVFIGEDGSLYDINYNPIKMNEELLKYKRGKWSDVNYKNPNENDENEKDYVRECFRSLYEFNYDPELYQNPPSPYSFSEFQEYEKALKDWANKVQTKLGYAQLPRILGRHYYRPYVHTVDKKSQPQYNSTFKNRNSTTTFSELDTPTCSEFEESTIDKKESFGFSNSFTTHETSYELDETWEASLIPIEPKPEFYETFEEYEAAMLKWSVLCCGLRVLPPHPAQFQNLIGIKLANYPNYPIPEVDAPNDKIQKDGEGESKITNKKNTKKKKSDEFVTSLRQSGDITSDKVFDTIYHMLKQNNFNYEAERQVQRQWDNLTESSKSALRNSFLEWLNRNKERLSKNFVHIEKYPKFHGTLTIDRKLVRTHSLENMKIKLDKSSKGKAIQESFTIDDIFEWIKEERQDKSLIFVKTRNLMPYYQATSENLHHQIPIRRTDLTSIEIDECKDCEDEVNGRTVEFRVPEFDIGQIETKMLEEKTYSRFIRVYLARMGYEGKIKKITTFYNPKINREQKNTMIAELNSLIQTVESPDNFPVSLYLKLFHTDAHLDVFSKWLGQKIKRKFPVTSGAQTAIKKNCDLLSTSCSLSHFKSLLSLFDDSNLELVHAKVSEFVLKFLSTKQAAENLRKLINKRDSDSLYNLARAVMYYDEVPSTLFYYNLEVKTLINQRNPEIESFIEKCIVIYYLFCISISLLDETKGYPDVYPLCGDMIDSLLKDIEGYLIKEDNFLKEGIWKLLGHRNRSISSLGQFLLMLLMFFSEKPSIYELMKSENTQLIDNIRKLAQSKFSHVQTAIARIFLMLQNDRWNSLLTAKYSNVENIIEDLINASANYALDAEPQLLSSMVIQFLSDSFKIQPTTTKCTLNMIRELVYEEAFLLVLKSILKTSHQKRLHQGTVMGTLFLSKFSKLLTSHRLIDVHFTEMRSTPTKSASNTLKNVSKTFLRRLKKGTNKKGSSSNTSEFSPTSSDVDSYGSSPGSPVLSPGIENIFDLPMSSSKKDKRKRKTRRIKGMTPDSPITSIKSDIFENIDNDEEIACKDYREHIELRLRITGQTLSSMLDFVSNENMNVRGVYKPKLYMLQSLRHLLKCPPLFRVFRDKEKSLFKKLHNLCADSTQMEFNKDSWKMFYQLIKYNTGVIEHLTKTNEMEDFVLLIGKDVSSRSIISTNAFHYFNKIFELPQLSSILIRFQQKLQRPELFAEFAPKIMFYNKQAAAEEEEDGTVSLRGSTAGLNIEKGASEPGALKINFTQLQKLQMTGDDYDEMEENLFQNHKNKCGFNIPSQEAIRSYEKSIQLLSQYLVNKNMLFIIHSSYEELVKQMGLPFQNMVSFYENIIAHPYVGRLKSSFMKTDNYREGMNRIGKMIHGKYFDVSG